MPIRQAGSHPSNRIPRAFEGPMVIAAGLDTLDLARPEWSSDLRDQLQLHGLGVHNTSIEDILTTTQPSSISIAPAIIVLSEHHPDRLISRLMDTLSQSAAAALVLVEPNQTRIRNFMLAEGILCEPNTIDAAEAAMILRTLAQRQPALQRLNTDLRLSEMTINGVQSEVAKLHEELQSAASIQREYLPTKTTELQGVDVGIIYRPASYVSGDIYDITQLDENRCAFFLADAVGHGVPAALMTMVITQGLRKIDGSGINAKVVEPADALRRLNNTMSEHAGENARFATAVYAVYDKSKNEITIAGAGHPPALIVRADSDETEMVDSQGPLLGIFKDIEFEQTTITLNPGDVLVFYSDGFEVAFPNNADNAHDRRRPTQTYIAQLSNAGNYTGNDATTLNESIRCLEENLDLQMGSLHQPDDITALFIAPRSQRSPALDSLVTALHEGPAPR